MQLGNLRRKMMFDPEKVERPYVKEWGHHAVYVDDYDQLLELYRAAKKHLPVMCCGECMGPLDGAFQKRTDEQTIKIVCSKCMEITESRPASHPPSPPPHRS
jgi:hypothetical protein